MLNTLKCVSLRSLVTSPKKVDSHILAILSNNNHQIKKAGAYVKDNYIRYHINCDGILIHEKTVYDSNTNRVKNLFKCKKCNQLVNLI